MCIKKIIREELDDMGWMDDIPSTISSCDDLMTNQIYKVNGKYVFSFNNTPITVRGTVTLPFDLHRPSDYIIIDFGKYMGESGYFETHTAEGICENKTCFYVRCDSLVDKSEDLRGIDTVMFTI